MEINCHCPWEGTLPSPFKTVSYPCRSVRINLSALASFAAAIQSSAVTQIFHNHPWKEIDLLKHAPKRTAQASLFNFINVNTVIADFAVIQNEDLVRVPRRADTLAIMIFVVSGIYSTKNF